MEGENVSKAKAKKRQRRKNYRRELADKKNKAKANLVDVKPGVVYVGHIPYGFFEKQMWKFFSQFGTVTDVKLCRSKRTGHSKGYAFVAFEVEDVAKIVAETMNNYLMYNRILKCQFIPHDQVHPDTFVTKSKALYHSSIPAVRCYNKAMQGERKQLPSKRTVKNLAKLKEKLAQHGVSLNCNLKSVESNASADATEEPSCVEMNTDSADVSLPVLELDSTDDEISFRIPDNVRVQKKVKK